MTIPYHIPVGEVPDDALSHLYDKQDDGSFLLQVDGLPQQEPVQDEKSLAETSQAETTQAEEASQAPSCHGAGAQIAGSGSGVGTQTIIAPHDAQAIQKSLHALASGAVRLGK